MKTIRARVKNGKLELLKPLPKSWKEGDEVELDGHRVVKRTAVEIDAAWAEIRRLCQYTGDEEHWRQVEATLAENDRLAKERHEMGLSKRRRSRIPKKRAGTAR